ncbi:outer membrane assembly protein AsmA [Vagococcus sp. WN89Y]|uniref:outer membrane assembly protein AsmA n=1 Tax=Vagococcus sp. WN89Y TaxID=3457258 RepID=UPI003FCCBCFF
MRRVLTTLMILLVVLVAGLSALVLLVNPNDFRAYMVRQVEARSGYQLQLDGPLRWHVWPQLSILTGRMTLIAPGAQTPVVQADNMRLDVNLWPLLSHQLRVKQVMLKGAVIQLTPQSAPVAQKDAPVGPGQNSLPQEEEDRGWSWDIHSLRVADSVLVIQHENDDQVTVRDIRLKMEQDEHHQASLDFSGRVTRNQRALALSLSAQVDARDYPHNLSAIIDSLQWQLQGGDITAQGISGEGRLQAQWQSSGQRLTLNALHLTANDSVLDGKGSVTFGQQPVWALDLQSDNLNLDNLLPAQQTAATSTEAGQQGQAVNRLPPPVIANGEPVTQFNGLRDFTAQIGITAKNVRWRGMQFMDVTGQLNNTAGMLVIPQLEGKLGGGLVSLPGSLDVRTDASSARFQPRLDNVEIGDILNAFNYPIALTGNLTMAGDFSGPRIDANNFRHQWQGEAHVELKNSRMEGLNFQQLIQQAVARNSDVEIQQNYDNATRLESFSANLALDHGLMTFSDMQGASPLLALTGDGKMDLVEETADTRFNVRVLEGWKGDGPIIDFLKKTPIPLRVYGNWQSLKYNLQVDQLLRKQLQDEAKRRLKEWADRNQDSQSGNELKKQLENR